MAFLSPVALGLFGLAAAVLALHLLGRRGQSVSVPSVRFWRGLGLPVGRLASARRRLSSLLLLLDLLAVALLALALARPALPAGPARDLVVLVDASASMQATDVRPSRFAEARRRALDLLSRLQPGETATVLRVGTTATTVGSTADGAPTLSRLVAGLEPDSGSADFAGAVALAAARLDPARQNPAPLPVDLGSTPEVVVLSDGGGVQSVDWGELPAPIRYEPIGRSDDNQGITALGVERPPTSYDRPFAFARVASFAARPVEVSLRALADGATFDVRHLALPARGYADLSLTPPADARLLEVRLEHEDVLALDDRAYAVLSPPGPIDVLLVSEDPAYLERALRLRPDAHLRVIAPAAYSPGDVADVVVFDRFLPQRLPAGNLLLLDPPAQAAPAKAGAQPPGADALSLGLGSSETLASPAIVGVVADDPLLRGVDLSGVQVRQARRLDLPPWARPVVSAADGPLVARGSVGSRRVVALAFALSDSDLPFHPAFPVLVANAVNWLRPLAVPAMARPGAVVGLDVPDGWGQLLARGPAGPVPILRPLGGPALLPLRDVGPYAVSARLPSGRPIQAALAASLLDEGESDVAPRPQPLASTPSRAAGSAQSQGEVWWPVALAACLVLLVEWAWYHRGHRRDRGWT